MFLSLKLRKLQRPHDSDRVEAIRQLHGEHHPDAVAAVLPLLDNASAAVRVEAARALPTMGWLPTTDEERVKVALIRRDWNAVERWGPDELSALLPLLRRRLAPSDQIARALATSVETAVVAPLRELLIQNHGPETARIAAEALAQINSPDAVDALIACGGYWGREALVKSRASSLVERLVVALTHGDEKAKATAGAVLAERPDPSAGPALLAAFKTAKHTDPELVVIGLPVARRSLRPAISRLHGVLPFETLVAALDDDDEQVREMAADEIGRSGSDLAFATLEEAVRREVAAFGSGTRFGQYPGVALVSMLRAIAALGHDRGLPVIHEAIVAVRRWRDDGSSAKAERDEGWYWIGKETTHLLPQCGSEATPVIASLLQDGLVCEAAIALRLHGDQRAVESLLPYASVPEVDRALTTLVGQKHPGAADWADWWARRGRFFSKYKLAASS